MTIDDCNSVTAETDGNESRLAGSMAVMACGLAIINLPLYHIPSIKHKSTLLSIGLKFDKSRELQDNAGAPAGTIVGRLRVVSRAAGGGLAGSDVDVNFSLHNSTSSDYADFHLDPKSGLLSTAK